MTDDLIERTATALAKSHGLDFDEVCGVDTSPDDGYCDSGTCIASGYEDHDAAYARACYRSDARAAIAIIAPAVLDMAAKVASEAHLVPPDGGSPNEDECRTATAARDAILAIKAQFQTETQAHPLEPMAG